MKPAGSFAPPLFLLVLIIGACSFPGLIATDNTGGPSAATGTVAPALAATDRPVPTAAGTPQPSPTPTQVVLDLEVVEWSIWPYRDGPDTHLEILVRNPNEFPVRVNEDETELRLMRGAAEMVYTNPNPQVHLWGDVWGLILPGETVPVSACLCFANEGIEEPEWETFELVTTLEEATAPAHTTDVELSLGEFQATLECASCAEATMTNASGQPLKSILLRVIARDRNGKYVGVAMWGEVGDWDDAGNDVTIPPGFSFTGFLASEIDDVSGPLDYEATTIGLVAEE